MATMECTAERERAGSSLGATDEFTAANRFGAARASSGCIKTKDYFAAGGSYK
jgi:hypothetical protein